MREWAAYVRARLQLPELEAGREAEIVEDLAQQLEEAEREALSSGATPEVARARARAHLPDWGLLREELLASERLRVPRLLRWGDGADVAAASRSGLPRLLGTLRADVLYGSRRLARSPGFTAVAIATLALGIGATTAIFSVVHAVLLRPLPFPAPGRLVLAFDAGDAPERERAQPSPGNFLDWRARSDAFDGMAAWYTSSRTLRHEAAAEQVQTVQVSGDFFKVWGIAPALGTVFTPEEAPGALYNEGNVFVGGDRVAVLSDAFWRRRFGADPGILDTPIRLDGQTWRVLGVMPPGFAVPDPRVDLWVPWDLARSYDARRFPEGPPRDYRFLHVAARLRDGMSLRQAEAGLQAIAADLEQRFPGPNQGWSVRLAPLGEEMVRHDRPALLMLFAAVGFVLLIACANVAGLQMARASARGQEMAVRTALGASRGRLLRQLLTESVLVSLAGAAAGLWLASSGLHLLVALAPREIPRLGEVRIDASVLLFTLVVSVATGLVFGLAPALQGSRADLVTGLKEGGLGGRAAGPARHRLRALLVVSEVALALLLLAGAGLFTRSFARLVAVDPGFDPQRLLVLRVFLDTDAYGSAVKSSQYYRQLLERLGALPGVASAAATTVLPMSEVGIDFNRPYWREGDPDPGGQAAMAGIRMVTPDYFSTMRIAVREGRAFHVGDRLDGAPVIMVNEELARRVWPGTSPVGRRLVIDYKRSKYVYEVVGVAGDTRYDGLRSRPQPEIFIPHAQNPYLAMNVVLRTTVDPRRLARAAETAALTLDPAQPVHSVTTMDHLLERTLAPDRFSMTLLGLLALVALVLAGVGLYGLTTHFVGLRTHEIGVRIAVGARPGQVFAMVLRQSCRLAAAGGAIGLVAALALTRLVGGLLYDVGSSDPATFVAVTLILAAVTIGAAWIPARRVLRIDPIAALRHE
jgi:putative ABC transport system permease protein